jgi:hypothetical protein
VLTSLTSTCVALALALAPAAAPASPAGPAAQQPASRQVRAAFRVATADFGGGRISADLVARIEALGLQELRGAGIITAVNGDYVVELVVAAGADGSGYVTTIVGFRGDEELAGSRRRSKCELCLEDELLVQITDLVKETATAVIHEAKPPPQVVASEAVEPVVAEPVVAEPTAAVTQEEDPPPPRGRLGRAGAAGVGAAVVGGLALGTGVGLLVVGERSERDYLAPSIALIGVGALSLFTGIGLLVIDREARREQALVPLASPNSAGLLWVGRF